MVNRWLRIKDTMPVPTVWLSMNPHCEAKMSGSLTPRTKDFQAMMIEECNAYTNERLLAQKLPYWDVAATLRTKDRCKHSSDGVHTKLYVSVMAAKMLFNHLCDHRGNWRGSTLQFV